MWLQKGPGSLFGQKAHEATQTSQEHHHSRKVTINFWHGGPALDLFLRSIVSRHTLPTLSSLYHEGPMLDLFLRTTTSCPPLPTLSNLWRGGHVLDLFLRSTTILLSLPTLSVPYNYVAPPQQLTMLWSKEPTSHKTKQCKIYTLEWLRRFSTITIPSLFLWSLLKFYLLQGPWWGTFFHVGPQMVLETTCLEYECGCSKNSFIKTNLMNGY